MFRWLIATLVFAIGLIDRIVSAPHMIAATRCASARRRELTC